MAQLSDLFSLSVVFLLCGLRAADFADYFHLQRNAFPPASCQPHASHLFHKSLIKSPIENGDKHNPLF